MVPAIYALKMLAGTRSRMRSCTRSPWQGQRQRDGGRGDRDRGGQGWGARACSFEGVCARGSRGKITPAAHALGMCNSSLVPNTPGAECSNHLSHPTPLPPPSATLQPKADPPGTRSCAGTLRHRPSLQTVVWGKQGPRGERGGGRRRA